MKRIALFALIAVFALGCKKDINKKDAPQSVQKTDIVSKINTFNELARSNTKADIRLKAKEAITYMEANLNAALVDPTVIIGRSHPFVINIDLDITQEISMADFLNTYYSVKEKYIEYSKKHNFGIEMVDVYLEGNKVSVKGLFGVKIGDCYYKPFDEKTFYVIGRPVYYDDNMYMSDKYEKARELYNIIKNQSAYLADSLLELKYRQRERPHSGTYPNYTLVNIEMQRLFGGENPCCGDWDHKADILNITGDYPSGGLKEFEDGEIGDYGELSIMGPRLNELLEKLHWYTHNDANHYNEEGIAGFNHTIPYENDPDEEKFKEIINVQVRTGVAHFNRIDHVDVTYPDDYDVWKSGSAQNNDDERIPYWTTSHVYNFFHAEKHDGFIIKPL